jgi:hypothetical protein
MNATLLQDIQAVIIIISANFHRHAKDTASALLSPGLACFHAAWQLVPLLGLEPPIACPAALTCGPEGHLTLAIHTDAGSSI